MKLVRTRNAGQAVTVPDARDESKTLTIGRVPVLVANDAAEKYADVAATVGVALAVTDAPEGTTEDAEATGQPSGVVPDLSKGIAAVTGTGDPVQHNPTPGDAGDTQED